jgi:hypothetical protein
VRRLPKSALLVAPACLRRLAGFGELEHPGISFPLSLALHDSFLLNIAVPKYKYVIFCLSPSLSIFLGVEHVALAAQVEPGEYKHQHGQRLGHIQRKYLVQTSDEAAGKGAEQAFSL